MMSRTASPASGARAGTARKATASPSPLKASRSAPTLREQLDQSAKLGSQSQVLGTLAQTLGARVNGLGTTIYHRGEHDVGAVRDPTDEHIYVPRAFWTETHDSPIKAASAQFDKQHWVGQEVSRLAGEARKKEYFKREVGRQLGHLEDKRANMRAENKEIERQMKEAVEKYKQDQKDDGADKKALNDRVNAVRASQLADTNRRSHQVRLNQAQEAAEMKMRVMQQICEELEVRNRRKNKLNADCRQGMKENEERRHRKREEGERVREEDRELQRQAALRQTMKEQADVDAFEGRRNFQEACYKHYGLNAGKKDHERNQAELNRIDRDEKMHTLRTDVYIDQRERARERQRQNMVSELNKQSEAGRQKGNLMRMRAEMERAEVQQSVQRAQDEEAEKKRLKREQEVKLVNENKVIMAEREYRMMAEGIARPMALNTMSQLSMRPNKHTLMGSTNPPSFLREAPENKEAKQVPSMSMTTGSLRPARKISVPREKIPIDTVLGGVVGTLGGGGGNVNTALYATGGPFRPRSRADEDRKLSSSWTEGLRPKKQTKV